MSTTFTCPEDGQGHVYSRISAPTRSRCEALLGAVEGTEGNPAQAVLYSSGLAACFAVLNRLLPHRVAIAGGYHGTHLVISQLRRLSGNLNFEAVSLPTPAEVGSRLSTGDVIWLETPINPTCDLQDIAAYAAAAKAVGGIHVVVDGTFAPPPIQRPLELGANVVLHATTKYLAGHSDVIGGALCVNDKELAEKLRQDRIALGSAPGNLETWLLMRSIRTVHLRVRQQSRTASALASWLHEATISPAKHHEKHGAAHPLHGLVHAVHHPSLPTHPSHSVALKQMPGGFGGCFALELATEDAARALPGALTLFRNATSLGGVESLVEWRRKYDNAISPLLLRISIGLEKGILKVSGRSSKI